MMYSMKYSAETCDYPLCNGPKEGGFQTPAVKFQACEVHREWVLRMWNRLGNSPEIGLI